MTMDLGKTIKDIRQKKGFKQTDFADMCGLSQSYLSSIEKGHKEPSLSVLNKISNSLAIPTQVLIFMSLKSDDISDDKKKYTFSLLEPTIKGIIKDVFIDK